MGWRAIVSLTKGRTTSAEWTAAMREEPEPVGKPKACPSCPLRRGGEWEEGATAAIAEATDEELATWTRWECHDSPRPCAGMRRLLNVRHG